MQPTIWLKNEKGEIWDLRPRDFTTVINGCFLQNISGTGFKTKLTCARVDNDFVVTEAAPQQVPITGTALFYNPAHLARFGEFVGGYNKTIKLYYDPNGLIDPYSQIDRPYYKQVCIDEMPSGEQDKSGMWKVKMSFMPMSAMWRRDTTVASTVSQIIGAPHIYSYTYPYFYQSESKLYIGILNEGERIGCRIEIKNKRVSASLGTLEWVCNSGSTRQYAKWLSSVGLAAGRTLVVDSTRNAQESAVYYDDNRDDVQDYQEANPQYINFIELLSGDNQIVFNLGTTSQSEVEVTVSYVEQVRIL